MTLLDIMDQPYPCAPGYKKRDTSFAAAENAAPKAPRLRRMCVDALRTYGPLTADQCAAQLSIDKLSIRPRFSELANAGTIHDTGERRLNESSKRAIVWSLAQ